MAQENRSASMNQKRFYFISSAFQDSDMVYDICCEMSARGIPICYDDGLPSDKKSEKQIDARIRDCREVIIFVAKDLSSPQNYQLRREYVAAQRFRKPVHIITLDDMIGGSDFSPSQVVDVMEGIFDFSEPPVTNPPEEQRQEPAQNPQPETLPELPAHDRKRRAKGKKEKKKREKPIIPTRTKVKAAGAAALAILLTVGVLAVIQVLNSVHRAVVPVAEISASDLLGEDTISGDATGYYQAGKDAVNVSLLKYRYDKEIKGMVITGLKNRKVKTLSVPQYITGRKVKMIGEEAFANCDKLTKIELPDSVTDIRWYAFAYCANLKEIHLPDSVVNIGSGAFFDCYSLEKIAIPPTVTVIDYDTFYSCTSLTEVELPSSLTDINSSAFVDCHSLKEIRLPDSLHYIGNEVFFNCDNLKKITIPANVTDIGYNVFDYCDGLTICGKSGSYAEEYANSYDISFSAI